MPKSLGGTAQRRSSHDSSFVHVTRLVSRSDPSIPLVSVYSPATWQHKNPFLDEEEYQQQKNAPRPRPSLQVYYTAPDADDPARLESAARALETSILSERHQGRDPAECDRLDVYGIPFGGMNGNVFTMCVEHQKSEIAARLGDKDWYIQRYDVGGSEWRRALVVVRNRQEDWVKDSTRRQIGLSVIFFDPVGQEESSDIKQNFWERRAESVEEEEVLIGDLKAELNWQHSASQFED
ncbi:hypothetical protein F4678DRAFT_434192 [Xylaria arbuscula]|nr:hypothetical protein F4678DRAFT_434192 [Xylaria arbuscula]